MTTSVSAAGSATFTSQIVSTNNDGAVTYVQTGGSPALLVSGSGLVTTSGTLAPGTYVATGTTSDPNDDTGTFTLTLDVGKLIQSVPATASVKVSGSPGYHDQLDVTGSDGAVTYVQTSGTPALVVSASGLVTTSGALTVGSYTAKGTTSDPAGDSGTFTLTRESRRARSAQSIDRDGTDDQHTDVQHPTRHRGQSGRGDLRSNEGHSGPDSELQRSRHDERSIDQRYIPRRRYGQRHDRRRRNIHLHAHRHGTVGGADRDVHHRLRRRRKNEDSRHPRLWLLWATTHHQPFGHQRGRDP